MWQRGVSGTITPLSRLSVAVAVILASIGCEGPGVPDAVAGAPRPFAGTTLRVACADPSFAAAAAPVIKTWAARTGATIDIVTDEALPADIVLLPPSELGKWAERGLVPVPNSLIESPTLRWSEVLGPYRNRLTRWGNQVLGVPVGGGGHVLVYRSDRLADPRFVEKFRERFSRDPAPPATWEDVAELAEIFRIVDGKPALPPLPTDPSRLVGDFFRIAASFDRVANTEVNGSANRPSDAAAALSFQFDIATGKPRLATTGFEAALRWLIRTQPSRSKNGPADPASALAEGRAMIAVLDLAELARLPNDEAQPRFGWVRVPGTRSGKSDNYVPYDSGGMLGVVLQRCQHPAAAFDLLLELGSPERSAELIASHGKGIGPFRNEHFDRTHWLSYGYGPRRTADLAAAVRGTLALDTTNPVFAPRGPDQKELADALARSLTEALTGRLAPLDALKQAEAAWVKLDEPRKADVLRWRRKAAGLD